MRVLLRVLWDAGVACLGLRVCLALHLSFLSLTELGLRLRLGLGLSLSLSLMLHLLLLLHMCLVSGLLLSGCISRRGWIDLSTILRLRGCRLRLRLRLLGLLLAAMVLLVMVVVRWHSGRGSLVHVQRYRS